MAQNPGAVYNTAITGLSTALATMGAVGEASAAGHALTMEQAQAVVALYFRQDLLEEPGSPEEPENPVP